MVPEKYVLLCDGVRLYLWLVGTIPDLDIGVKTMALPINLMILKTVQEFKKIPLDFLYTKVSAPPEDIKRQVTNLVAKGAIKLVEGVLTIKD